QLGLDRDLREVEHWQRRRELRLLLPLSSLVDPRHRGPERARRRPEPHGGCGRRSLRRLGRGRRLARHVSRTIPGPSPAKLPPFPAENASDFRAGPPCRSRRGDLDTTAPRPDNPPRSGGHLAMFAFARKPRAPESIRTAPWAAPRRARAAVQPKLA